MPHADTIPGGVDRAAFRDELVARGLLLTTGVPGIYGRSAEFEDTLLRVDRVVERIGADDRPEVMRFPPTLPRTTFERSGFLKSFPHLAGTVRSFAGDEHTHRALLHAVEQGKDWGAAFASADLVLTPAACYPVYPQLTGTLPARGRLVDVMSYCFRHEPADDPARMQMFRMHEHVRAADIETVADWRDAWLTRLDRFVDMLGLDARRAAASDPFFGRAGKLLADSQRDQGLKTEIVVPIASEEHPTAIISLNYHQDHFGQAFRIDAADGSVAHTSCVGFGLERITLALYRRHGLDRRGWPPAVRNRLGL
jgi:seryl-tRNA synthetase